MDNRNLLKRAMSTYPIIYYHYKRASAETYVRLRSEDNAH